MEALKSDDAKELFKNKKKTDQFFKSLEEFKKGSKKEEDIMNDLKDRKPIILKNIK